MAWIKVIPDEQWTTAAGQPALAGLHPSVVDRESGQVDHIMAIHSLNPAAMIAHNQLYGSAMSGTRSLRKVERELIALVVSQHNECHY